MTVKITRPDGVSVWGRVVAEHRTKLAIRPFSHLVPMPIVLVAKSACTIIGR